MRLKDYLIIFCLWIPLILSIGISSCIAQNIAPKQIMPATILRVPNPAKQYALVSVPSDGGRFWYKDIDSLKKIPNWQQVTDVGDITNRSVTAAGLTLTQLTSGGSFDSLIVVKNGLLKRVPRYAPPIVQQFSLIASSADSNTNNSDPFINFNGISAVTFQDSIDIYRWRMRSIKYKEVQQDSQAFLLNPNPKKSGFDLIVQSRLNVLQFVSNGFPIDTMCQQKFRNVEYGSVFRCQLIRDISVSGLAFHWFIYKVTNTVTRQDTFKVYPNRSIQLYGNAKQIFLTERTGTWTQGDGIEFKLPKAPSDGQEIVITPQFLMANHTEFRFTATGGYAFKFPTAPTKVFAFDPLDVNTTANNKFTTYEVQFRCQANTIDRLWSCFVTAQ